jgi:ABC-type transport system involved in multi-copper enzyme maturation permease subunit
MRTASTGQTIPVPARTETVFMGRQDFFSVVLRLIGVELYKIRRRLLSKVLASIAVGAAIGIFLLNFLLFLLFSRGGEPSQVADIVAAQLGLPISLHVVVQTILTVGRILIIALAGIVVGEEYGVGTVRLMLTRGPTRIQFLLAKIGALMICSGIGILGMTLSGILIGQFLTPFTTFHQSLGFLNVAWVGHAFLLLLYLLLGLIVYALMAVFFATLGKATAAGIGITLVWVLVVEVLGETLGFIGKTVQGTFGTILVWVSKGLIGPNIDALLQNQSYYLFGNVLSQSDVPDGEALLVFAFYVVLFVGLSWWITERRDVTN